MRKIFTIIYIFTFLIAGYLQVNAQEKGPEFGANKSVHDFGSILESDGPVTGTFKIFNRGDKPLVINNVVASCGCTTSGWTKEPISPGDTGFIKATYDPRGRVYPFDKAITIYTNGTPKSVVFYIKGVVLPKPIDFKVVFPFNIGYLRLKKTDIDLGTFYSNTTKTAVIEIANAEEEAISFSFDKSPDYIKITAEPSILQPKQQGLIRINFDPSKKNTLGYSSDDITIKQGTSEGVINIKAIVQEFIQKSNNSEFGNDPRIILPKYDFDFGETTKGKSITATYEITNEGKTDLIIHNATSSDKGVKSTIKGIKIKPGKKTTIKLPYTPLNEGDVRIPIYLTSNDPGYSLITLYIKGKVK